MNKLKSAIILTLSIMVLSCSGGDDSGNPNNNPNGGGNSNLDSRLVCGAGEGWKVFNDDIYVFRANGTYSVYHESNTGSSWQVSSEGTWLTTENENITISGCPYSGTYSYSVPNSITFVLPPCSYSCPNYYLSVGCQNGASDYFRKVVGLPSSVK
jgi:hypothetical protein